MRSTYFLFAHMLAGIATAALYHDQIQDHTYQPEPKLQLGDDHQPAGLPKSSKYSEDLASEIPVRQKKPRLIPSKRVSGRRNSASVSRPARKSSQSPTRTKKGSSLTSSRTSSPMISQSQSSTDHVGDQHHPSSYLSYNPPSHDLHSESKVSTIAHNILDPLFHSSHTASQTRSRFGFKGGKPVQPKSLRKDRGLGMTALTQAETLY